MRATDRLTLSSSTVAALPIVNHFLDRLHFAQLLGKHLPPPDPRTQTHCHLADYMDRESLNKWDRTFI